MLTYTEPKFIRPIAVSQFRSVYTRKVAQLIIKNSLSAENKLSTAWFW